VLIRIWEFFWRFNVENVPGLHVCSGINLLLCGNMAYIYFIMEIHYVQCEIITVLSCMLSLSGSLTVYVLSDSIWRLIYRTEKFSIYAAHR